MQTTTSFPTNFSTAFLSKRPAFTIVEVLVVISIIAVLVSMLIPSMAQARKQSQIVLEQGNMRQVGSAVNLYAYDYKYHLPGSAGYGSGHPTSTSFARSLLFADTTKGTPGYLDCDPILTYQIGTLISDGPTSKIWGCPVTFDIGSAVDPSVQYRNKATSWYRYDLSWWWNAGQDGTVDADGNPISCALPDGYTSANSWMATPVEWASKLYVDGRGYTAGASNSNTGPDYVQLISDNGGGPFDGFPQHVTGNNTSGTPAGCNALFISGRVAWRNGSTMHQNLWLGGSPVAWR